MLWFIVSPQNSLILVLDDSAIALASSIKVSKECEMMRFYNHFFAQGHNP